MKTLRETIRDKKYPNGFMRPVFPRLCAKTASKRIEQKVVYLNVNGRFIELLENYYS